MKKISYLAISSKQTYSKDDKSIVGRDMEWEWIDINNSSKNRKDPIVIQSPSFIISLSFAFDFFIPSQFPWKKNFFF